MNKETKEILLPGRELFDLLPDPVFALDTAGRVILWNHAIEELTGVMASDILGKDNYEHSIPFYKTRRPALADLLLKPDPAVEQQYRDFKRKGNSICGESCAPGIHDGETFLWCIAKTIYDSSGRITGAIESIRNNTVYIKSSETITRQNTELETVNRKLSSVVNELREKNSAFEETNSQLIMVKEEIVKTNELLRVSDEKFSKAFKNSPVVLTLSTVAEGRYVDVSDNFYAATGWTKDEVMGHTVHDIDIWSDEEDRQRVISELRQKGCARELEIRFRKKNGEIRTKLFSCDIIEVGGVPCLLAMNSDITDRITAEEANRLQKIELEKVNTELKKTILEIEETHRDLIRTQQELIESNRRLLFSEEKFSKTVHLGPVVITLSRLSDGVYVDASEYFLKLTGHTREEVIGHSALELNIWADTEDRARVMSVLKQDGLVRGLELKFLSKNGTVLHMNYSAEVITIAGELHLVSVAVDISAKKAAEEEKSRLEHQLQQSQKMETVGRLAGGIAHDFNNLLTAILGNVELCMIKAGTGSSLYPNLAMIKKASESAADLTKRILAFSRKQIIDPEVIDLNDMINHMHNMLERLIGEDLRLDTTAMAPNPKILADPGQIEQIIMNLSVNARDAMNGGGRLAIKTGNVLLDSEYCRSHAYAIPGEYVLLSVTDTGSGMTAEVKKHLFEPFYTTKPKGKGTGLGLSMVYGAIKQNNGTVEVESEEGKGTCFNMYFPVYYGEAADDSGRPDRDMKYGGEETVLLVEDNQMVLEFAAHILEEAGFRVLEAQSGEAAQDMEISYTGMIDLLLTDVVMPGINGKALAEFIRKKRPEMKVILTSGYTEDIIKQQKLSEEGISFIGKPYSANSLLQKVREVLDR
ncbi:MAG TPA: PAS domain S-box protein [Spirochaetota bacterium]|nr:PAS domain S-box protein [Spirochaetota bacterium]